MILLFFGTKKSQVRILSPRVFRRKPQVLVKQGLAAFFVFVGLVG